MFGKIASHTTLQERRQDCTHSEKCGLLIHYSFLSSFGSPTRESVLEIPNFFNWVETKVSQSNKIQQEISHYLNSI